jgi:hypothetical protein
MNNRRHVPLRERAVRAWQKERPTRIAQLLKRADLALDLRKKLEGLVGDDLPIIIVSDLRGRPIAMVEELRFTLTNYHGTRRRRLMLLDVCPRCEAETGLIINSLADLGQLFEGMGTKISLGCTECIGLTDDELKP